MITTNQFKAIALKLPQAEESPHFEKTSFKIKKKIFATLDEANAVVTIKLSEIDQSVYCSIDKSLIYPVAGKWGTHGWTMINLSKVTKKLLVEVLNKSYETVLNGKT